MISTIGIDLGTTFSAVAYVEDTGKPVILKNALGEALTPSVIYFSEDEIIIGSEAKEMQSIGEEDSNIAAFYKRNMGDPNFILFLNGKEYSSEDLSAIFLKKLKDDAETALGFPIKNAVITVPAYFSNAQREATKRAGEKAGLKVSRVINEPTAAAIAFGLNKNTEQRLLVYDLGGGTFDITVMEISEDTIKVLGTDGDHELGGKNWDDRLITFAAAKFTEEYQTDPLTDSVSFNDLLVRAENTKKQLSSRREARLDITHNGEKGRYTITVDEFESITADLLERTQMLTKRLLTEIKKDWSDIDGVLLVGGSTRMPMVQEWVKKMSGKEPLHGINVDEAVALGAAVQAHTDANGTEDASPKFTLGTYKKVEDVMSHSLGMVAENGDRRQYVNSKIINKNNIIPCTQSQKYQIKTRFGNDNELEVYLLQGESSRPSECNILGKYLFSNIAHKANDAEEIEVTYAYDSSGIVQVVAKQTSTGQELIMSKEAVPEDMSWLDTAPRDRQSETVSEPFSVLIAVDLSGSMSGKPLKKAQEAAQGFIDKLDLNTASIGLMPFADSVKMNCPLCKDGKKLKAGIREWSIGMVGFGNSDQPFSKALQILKKEKARRFLIVLTDGIWSKQQTAKKEAEKCKNENIEIIALGFGGADEHFLRKIATSDENALLTNLGSLVDDFSKIAQVMGGGLRVEKKKSGLSFFKR